jgi:S-formylglutathione hydrolase FrmB
MRMKNPPASLLTIVSLFVVGAGWGVEPERGPVIELSFSGKTLSAPFTGRVLVVASTKPIGDGPFRQPWFKPEPFFAQDVKAWQPDQPLAFTPTAHSPTPPAKLPAGKYFMQAILDRDLGGQSPFASPGNLYSKPVAFNWDPAKCEPIKLVVDQTVAPRKFTETARVKLVDIPSKLLSDFHGKPMRLRAGVVLPKSAAKDPARRYPVVYEIPGFGGDHFAASGAEARNATDVGGEDMIWVMLDPACRLGHHVFADSDNNGPCGKALIEELIPYIEKTYGGLGTPGTRFVTGHSSGGWSSLWLQVTYPDFFGGVWSTAPDSVDFRDFQLVDIYRPKTNIFFDDKNEPRPLARKGKEVTLRYKPFNDMEVVMGRGGQLFSFEAVFSPKGQDGKPQPLWDRATGLIDSETAKAWQRYDIRMIVENNWKTLAPKLAGKIHVYMGAEDTFYLDGATRLLQASLKALGSDAKVEIFPGKHHGNLIDQNLRQRMNREMAEAYRGRS